MAAPGGDTAMAQEAATAMVTEPPNGENITDPTPTIKANLESMGALDDGTIAMRVSGLGQVPAKYDPASKNISYTVTTPLKPASYRVIVSAKSTGGRSKRRGASLSIRRRAAGSRSAASAPTAPGTPKKKKP